MRQDEAFTASDQAIVIQQVEIQRARFIALAAHPPETVFDRVQPHEKIFGRQSRFDTRHRIHEPRLV